MVAVLGFSKEEIREAVRDMYTIVAEEPETPLHFPIGHDACLKAGYSEAQIGALPSEVVESFAGVGCPFHADIIQPGQTVLDVGSGSGTDVLIAAQLVGETGTVKAFDLTPAMREKLQHTLDQHSISNVEIVAGDAETLPLPDNSVDVVTSNGVLNLVADKRRAIKEIFRVLKPGGKVQIADIVIASPVTPDCEDDPKLWAECVVGATVDESYLEMFRDAGFENIEILRDYDYFAYSPSEETREVATQFGAHAFELRMTRKAKAPAAVKQLACRLNPLRLIRSIQRRGLWGTLSFVLAALTCYGTLALVSLMSVLGVSMAFNEAIWATTIVGFVYLATLITALGMRKHGSLKPVVIAITGSTIMTYTMFFNYQLMIELLAFGCIGLASYFDYDLRRWAKVKGGKQSAPRQRRNSHKQTMAAN